MRVTKGNNGGLKVVNRDRPLVYAHAVITAHFLGLNIGTQQEHDMAMV